MSGPLNRTQVWASEFSQNLSQPQQAPTKQTHLIQCSTRIKKHTHTHTHTHTLTKSWAQPLNHKKKKTFPLHLLVSPLVASKEAFRTGTTMPARSVFWFGASRYQCWIRLPLKSIHWPFFSGALTLTALNALGEVRERASLWNTGALDWSVCWAADTWCNTNLLLALQGPCALMHESHQWVCVCVCVRSECWWGTDWISEWRGESIWRLDRKERRYRSGPQKTNTDWVSWLSVGRFHLRGNSFKCTHICTHSSTVAPLHSFYPAADMFCF